MSERVPDRVGVLLGYRSWMLSEKGLMGRSVRPDAHWSLDGHTEACCVFKQHIAPHFACGCGLHARYEPCVPYLPRLADHDVWGAVVAWGKIVHHKRNSFFRAQKALPIALLCRKDNPNRGTFERLCRSVGAAVIDAPTELIDYAQEGVAKWT